MNTITLDQILSLVGTLDDTPGENTPRERFRTFLRQNVAEVGQIRDYVEQCLRTSGTQYARALQDLINHLGQLLGFKVTFGRYQGVQGKIGFDGHWVSPKGFHAVVEVKTTEVYSVQTSTLLNYMNQLVSESAMEPDAECMGIYIIGKPDPNVKQLHNSILAEKKTDKLTESRII